MSKNSGNLDFLRTVAVLAVVLRHVLGELGFERLGPFRLQFLGIFGVMLFFVHTAHVLMLSLERQRQEQPRSLYAHFIVRRAFRIYPLSVVVVLIGLLATQLGSAPGFAQLSAGDALANVLLVQNLTGSANIIGPLWSLPIEVQMYLFLPAVFLLVRTGLGATAAVYAASIAVGMAAFKAPLPEVFRFFPCFIPGVVAFGLAMHGARRVLPYWVLPVLLLVAFASYATLGPWSQTVGAYPACLAVGLAIPFLRESPLQRLNALCGTVAKYSYGVYLIHAPALALSFTLPMPVAAKLGLFAGVTAILSVLAYRFVEHPLVEIGKAVTRAPAQVATAA